MLGHALTAGTGPARSEPGVAPELRWLARAACVTVDPEVFFPDRRAGDGVVEAKAVCAPCPVRLECLGYATADPALIGIWGGCTEDERRRLRRRSTRELARASGP